MLFRSKSDQVRQSLASSLENLRTSYVDSLVMHGPEDNWDDMLEVWMTFEELVDSGKVKQIGISNFYHAPAVKFLYEKVRIKPAVVQNRFYGDTNYDVEIRKFCLEKGIEYQTFWTLGANRHFTSHETVKQLAKDRRVSPEAVLYALVMKLGHTPLDGTTSLEHMKEDIELVERIRSNKNGYYEEEIVSDADLPGLLEILGIPPSDDVDEEEEL